MTDTAAPGPVDSRLRGNDGGGRDAMHRHTGFKAVSKGQDTQQDNINHQSPSPLMGEESKARVKQDNTTNPGPSFPRRRESTGQGCFDDGGRFLY